MFKSAFDNLIDCLAMYMFKSAFDCHKLQKMVQTKYLSFVIKEVRDEIFKFYKGQLKQCMFINKS